MQARKRTSFPLVPVAVLVLSAACAKHEPPLTEIVAAHAATLPGTASDPQWRDLPAYHAPLLLQDLVEPRLLDGSTSAVQVQALTDGARIAFRLTWSDSTRDDLPGPAHFIDACAVQFPTQPGPNLPAPQMGEPGGSVSITYWTAAWQAELNGRPDSIQAIYPRATVDHYPFEAASLEPESPEQLEMEKRYRPAEGAGHPGHRAGQPVQDLVAEGPGTLTVVDAEGSAGHGEWRSHAWEVVILRAIPEALRGESRLHVALAVWNGAHDEVGARKMRSAWIPLSLEARP